MNGDALFGFGLVLFLVSTVSFFVGVIFAEYYWRYRTTKREWEHKERMRVLDLQEKREALMFEQSSFDSEERAVLGKLKETA